VPRRGLDVPAAELERAGRRAGPGARPIGRHCARGGQWSCARRRRHGRPCRRRGGRPRASHASGDGGQRPARGVGVVRGGARRSGSSGRRPRPRAGTHRVPDRRRERAHHVDRQPDVSAPHDRRPVRSRRRERLRDARRRPPPALRSALSLGPVGVRPAARHHRIDRGHASTVRARAGVAHDRRRGRHERPSRPDAVRPAPPTRATRPRTLLRILARGRRPRVGVVRPGHEAGGHRVARPHRHRVLRGDRDRCRLGDHVRRVARAPGFGRPSPTGRRSRVSTGSSR
jgi:hypothetical protein